VAAYEAFLRKTRRVAPKLGSDCNLNAHAGSLHPINCVTWQKARDYCAWVGMRLPTDAEWEYAARGWEGRKFPWGAEAPSRTRLNSFGEECRASGLVGPKDAVMPWNDGFCGTAPVGSFPEGATPDGVLDLAGNVWEWTEGECEPPEPLCMRGGKIARGGDFMLGDADMFRGTVRRATPPNSRNIGYGFRCAVSVDE
jgi:formylglycine-generating enzyme required for sulfatase activity